MQLLARPNNPNLICFRLPQPARALAKAVAGKTTPLKIAAVRISLIPLLLSIDTCQYTQDFSCISCDSCGLKFLISRELFQKVAMKVVVFLGVCCDKIAGASESCDKKSRKFPFL